MVIAWHRPILVVDVAARYARVEIDFGGEQRMGVAAAWIRIGRIEPIGGFVTQPELIDDLGDDEIATVQREKACDEDAVIFEVVQDEVACQLTFLLRLKRRHDAEMPLDKLNFLTCEQQTMEIRRVQHA